MIEDRFFDGRKITLAELDAVLKIFREVNMSGFIRDGRIYIEAEVEGRDDIPAIANIDLRRLACASAEGSMEIYGESGVLALAGVFAKCEQIVLSAIEPTYDFGAESEGMMPAVRFFAANDSDNE